MILGIKASNRLGNLVVIPDPYSLATSSPAYQQGGYTISTYTHPTTDLAGKTRVASNNPSIGAFGWTL